MRPFLALFRSVDRLARFSRRHPARRGGAARAQCPRPAAMTPRAVGGFVALAVFIADQAAKAAVLVRSGEAAQGSAAGQTLLLALIVVAIALLGWWLSNARSITAAAGLGAIIGGALGNVSDRIIHGAVVDYLD